MKIVLGLFDTASYIDFIADGYMGYRSIGQFAGFGAKYNTCDIVRTIVAAMLDATEIHFTLEGYDVEIASTFEHSYTRYELWLALEHKELRIKTKFYHWPEGITEADMKRHIAPSKTERMDLLQLFYYEQEQRA